MPKAASRPLARRSCRTLDRREEFNALFAQHRCFLAAPRAVRAARSARGASGAWACCENRGSMNQRTNRVVRSGSTGSRSLGAVRRHLRRPQLVHSQASSRSRSLRVPSAQPHQDHEPPSLSFQSCVGPNGALRVRSNSNVRLHKAAPTRRIDRPLALLRAT